MHRLIIAVDGYSSCGKSTFAKAIARRMGYVYIDTGAMYRAVTLFALEQGMYDSGTLNRRRLYAALPDLQIDFAHDGESGQPEIRLNGKVVEDRIRSGRVADLVSEVSALKPVRTRMTDLQRRMGADRGVVMDGRDIGTVIFPDADIKIFMTADSDVRAMRRLKELQQKHIETTFEEVKANILKRDRLDKTRKNSPLRQAEDAIILDNSHMTPEDQMVWFEDILQKLQA
ncbi:MAG: (d)CMP kinase [Bacteroidales bacterium]|nr:(d)CMP kinase [Bacteroidales bacterium]